MRRSVVAGLFLGMAVLAGQQPASAQDFPFFSRHPKVDQRVATVSLGTGLAATGAYFAIKDGHHGVDWSAWGITTVGCAVLGPMIAAAFTPERELTTREVMVMQGSCLIPVIGGILVNALFDANPQWEAPTQPVRVVRRR